MKCACGKTISGNKVACRACIDEQVTKSAVSAAPLDGVLEILNVAAGDVKITFDKANPVETIRAKRIITDMLRRGYALIVEVERDGKRAYERVQEFDERTGEYLIADLDPLMAREVDMQDTASDLRKKHDMDTAAEEFGSEFEVPPVSQTPDEAKPRRGRPRTRLPMETTKATAVGRSAGG